MVVVVDLRRGGGKKSLLLKQRRGNFSPSALALLEVTKRSLLLILSVQRKVGRKIGWQ